MQIKQRYIGELHPTTSEAWVKNRYTCDVCLELRDRNLILRSVEVRA